MKLVYSYADEDKELLDQIRLGLGPLKNVCQVEDWERGDILGSQLIPEEISRNFQNADVILMLISAAYLNGSEHTRTEWQIAQQYHSKGMAKIVPILGKPTAFWEDWVMSYFGRLEALPSQGPLTTYPDMDTALLELNEGLRQMLEAHTPQEHTVPSILTVELMVAALQAKLEDQYVDFQLMRSGAVVTVFRAWDPHLERSVVFKALNPWARVGSDDIRKDLDEARLEISRYSRYRHRHIKMLYAGWIRDPLSYVVMEYINGNTICEILKIEGPQPIWEVKKVLRSIADALHYGHRRGLVHNYVNPDNIYMDEEFLPVISPFKMLNTARLVGNWKPDNLRYWSPEVLRDSRDVDHASDQFSLGLIGYEMICGTPLFPGETNAEVLDSRNRIREDSALIRSELLKHGAPEELVSLLLQMLRFDPRKRFPNMRTVGELAAELPVVLDPDAMLALASYERSSAAFPNLIERFYDVFFRNFPAARPFFSKLDMQHQYLKLHHAINVLLALRSHAAPTTLLTVSDTHREMQIPAEMFEGFMEAFVEVIRDADPKWSGEVDEAWRKVFAKGLKWMVKRSGKPPETS